MATTGRILTMGNVHLKTIDDNLHMLFGRTDTLKSHQEDIDATQDAADEKYNVLTTRLDGVAEVCGTLRDVENRCLEIGKKMPKLQEICDIANAGLRTTADAQEDVLKQARDSWFLCNIRSCIKVDAATIHL